MVKDRLPSTSVPRSGAPARVLLVDDSPEFLRETAAQLRPHFAVTVCSSPLRAVRQVRKQHADLLLTTLQMRELDGLEVIRRVRGEDARIPVIMVTAYGDENSAIEAMRLGANDYLNQPVEPGELIARVARALAAARAPEPGRTETRGPAVVTQDAQLQRILDLGTRAAATESRVLILGETGTGKELIARHIHAHSARRSKPFVEVNCAAIPAALIESELFGHERGAFTGATERRIGRFEEASGGTLFLDEIGELSRLLQAKLLRVLQTGEFSRVGGSRTMHSDARIIAATNRDLEKDTAAGRFRADLYYRLNVVTLQVPPLRERPADIPALVDHFNRRFTPPYGQPLTFDGPAMRRLAEYPWPGNVRELEHVIERLAVLSAGACVGAQDLPLHLATAVPAHEPGRPTQGQTFREAKQHFERDYFGRLLAEEGNNGAAGARRAGMDRAQFFRKIHALGLHQQKRMLSKKQQ